MQTQLRGSCAAPAELVDAVIAGVPLFCARMRQREKRTGPELEAQASGISVSPCTRR